MAHPTRPWIGINTDFVAAGKSTTAYARLQAGYFDTVLVAGGLPFLFPPLGKKEIDAVLDRCDGVLLSSGLDMDPRRLGLPTNSAVQPMAARRDESDLILVMAPDARKPMPPRDSGYGPLPQGDVDIIRQWIAGGAKP